MCEPTQLSYLQSIVTSNEVGWRWANKIEMGEMTKLGRTTRSKRIQNFSSLFGDLLVTEGIYVNDLEAIEYEIFVPQVNFAQ